MNNPRWVSVEEMVPGRDQWSDRRDGFLCVLDSGSRAVCAFVPIAERWIHQFGGGEASVTHWLDDMPEIPVMVAFESLRQRAISGDAAVLADLPALAAAAFGSGSLTYSVIAEWAQKVKVVEECRKQVAELAKHFRPGQVEELERMLDEAEIELMKV